MLLFLSLSQFFVNKYMEKDTPAQERISQILMYAGIITHCMCYFNSAINPIIYYFMSAQFKVSTISINNSYCIGSISWLMVMACRPR